MCQILSIFFVIIASVWCKKDDIIFMSTPRLIEYWGYKVENHTIRTDDDYILTLHRIPNRNSRYYPILIQHGILLASDSWVLRGPKEDLVLLLADKGFDIWLANTRGNVYSKKHGNYRSRERRYWNFGWNELGIFDIPAMIDHIQTVTGRSKIVHIGHSMGTTSFYAMLAKKPHLNEKLYAHISLAPVAYMSRMRCLEVLRPLALIATKIVELQNMFRLYDFFSRDRRISLIVSKICNRSKRNKKLCYKLLFYLVGPDYDQMKEEYFDRFIGHFPSGASATMLVHFVQNILSEEFREFDYGPEENMERYGQTIPPHYNLTKIKVPTYLYYSKNDFLSHHLDVEKLASKLPNVKKKYVVPYRNFNHIDYIYARDSKKLLFDDIIKTLREFRLY